MKSNKDIYAGSHFKKILQKGSWYLISSVANKAIALFILPVVTRYLSPSDYGILSSLDSISNLLPVLISLSLDAAYFRFYFNHNNNKSELRSYISTYFWFIIGWGVFVVAGGLVFGKIYLTKVLDLPFAPYIPLTMIGPLLLQLGILGGAHLRQQLKSEIYSIVEFLVHSVYVGVFIYLLIAQKLGIKAKVYALFISNIIFLLTFSVVVFKEKLISFNFNKKILIEGLKYSIPLLPNQLSVWITGLSSRLILLIFKSAADTGIYSIGYQLGITLRLFTLSIFRVYSPIMFSMLIDNKEEGIKRIEKFITPYFFIMFWLAFCLGLFAKEFVYLMTESSYHQAYIVTPIVAFAYFCGAFYKPFAEILSFHKKTWLISIGAIVQAISNLTFNIIFIPVFGQLAAAWTTFVSMFIYFLWLFLWSKRYEKIKIEYYRLGLILLTGSITVGIYLAANNVFELDLWVNFGFKIVLIILALMFSFGTKQFSIKELKNIRG